MPNLEITTKIGCKVACTYCPQDVLAKAYQSRSSTKMMSLQDFKTCINKCEADLNIHFTGYSEPWLNPDCTEMMLYCHNRGHRIGVSTTLVGMTMADFHSVKDIPFKFFWLHLPSKESYERIPVDDHYIGLIESIAACNIDAKYHYHGEALHPKLDTIKDEARQVVVWDRAKNLKENKKNLPINKKKSIRKEGEIACSRVYQGVLLPNGDVTLCCMDYGNKHIIGNLLKQDYQEMFASEEFKKILTGLKDEKIDILCRTCVCSMPNYLFEIVQKDWSQT